MTPPRSPRILVIAGIDPTAGAGMAADLRAITAAGGRALCAVSALSAQTDAGVCRVWPVEGKVLAAQIACACESGTIDAVKIGQVADSASVRILAQALRRFDAPIVIDPVFRAHAGGCLHVDTRVPGAMRRQLLPAATLITPNIDEARVLSGLPIDSPQEQIEAARCLARDCKSAVFLKGGHGRWGGMVRDVLAEADGGVRVWKSRRLVGAHRRGTGCALASVTALELARGRDLSAALERGRSHVRSLLRAARAA